MKIIDKFVLKSFVGPFFLAFLLALFVLLLQFLWKYIDDLVGKGLDTFVIFQLLFYTTLSLVPTALPIGSLFSSIMVMGNFGERYELIAMKSSGIALVRVMLPIAAFIFFISIVSFYFSNNIIPYANLKTKTLLNSITHKKPALNIKAGEYYKDIDGYIIRVGTKKSDGKTLENVTIYDHTEKLGNISYTFANTGEMYLSENQRYLIFDLYDGYNFQENIIGKNAHTRPLVRLYFKKQSQRFDLASFSFNKESEELNKDSYQMMSLMQIRTIIDSLEIKLQEQKENTQLVIKTRYNYLYSYYSDTLKSADTAFHFFSDFEKLEKASQDKIMEMALQNATNIEIEINNNESRLSYEQMHINKYYIETHRKFTLPVACLILFMIGAPFGSIVRKGGLGLPLVVSVVMFVIYHVITMISEKTVREDASFPIGMWIPTFALIPIGLFLTLKATVDSPLFDLEIWQKTISQWISKIKKKKTFKDNSDSGIPNFKDEIPK